MELKSLQRMKRRVGYFGEVEKNDTDTRVESLVKADQWTRMRQDKLRSLKKALFYSYQAACVQQYDARRNSAEKQLISIISALQVQEELSQTQIEFLNRYEKLAGYDVGEMYTDEFIALIEEVLGESSFPKFRCLINHDKLKVDYEDKIISIPFEEKQYGQEFNHDAIVKQTNFHNGTVFKWIHGNKEEWVPDTYWIVYMQYSEQTAYFRGEIRRADEEILILDADGNTLTYRGWSTGPDEKVVLWNVKKNVTWNNLNYTKLLYISRDSETLAFFRRCDRIGLWNNAKQQYDYWEVQAYNDNYGANSSNTDTGIIRVALKETYTDADTVIDKIIAEEEEEKETQRAAIAAAVGEIVGPTTVRPYDEVIFVASDDAPAAQWSISNPELAKIVAHTVDNKKIKVSVITSKSNAEGFDVIYGDLHLHISVTSL